MPENPPLLRACRIRPDPHEGETDARMCGVLMFWNRETQSPPRHCPKEVLEVLSFDVLQLIVGMQRD